ncbi:hypothetical protein LEP1GSC051_2196 [Leptospira sp. P2653]|nr:hypothetical protein LEP1GSC051_2196 [Leptospira sp. P2653]
MVNASHLTHGFQTQKGRQFVLLIPILRMDDRFKNEKNKDEELIS